MSKFEKGDKVIIKSYGEIFDTLSKVNTYFNDSGMKRYCGHTAIVIDASFKDNIRLKAEKEDERKFGSKPLPDWVWHEEWLDLEKEEVVEPIVHEFKVGQEVRIKSTEYMREHPGQGVFKYHTGHREHSGKIGTIIKIDYGDNSLLVSVGDTSNWYYFHWVNPALPKKPLPSMKSPGPDGYQVGDVVTIANMDKMPDEFPHITPAMKALSGKIARIERRDVSGKKNWYGLDPKIDLGKNTWKGEWLQHTIVIEPGEYELTEREVFPVDKLKAQAKSILTNKRTERYDQANKNGKTVIVPRKTPTITRGERPTGSIIVGKRSRSKCTVGHLTNRKVTGH